MVVEILLVLVLGIIGSSFTTILFYKGRIVIIKLLSNLTDIDIIIR